MIIFSIFTNAPSIVYSSAPIPALVFMRTLKRRAIKTEGSARRTIHTTTRPADLGEYMIDDRPD